MNRILIVLICAATVAGCRLRSDFLAAGESESIAVAHRASSSREMELPPGHPPIDPHSDAAPDADGGADDSLVVTGTVAQTMNAAGYTYVRIRTTKGKDVWTAVPAVNLQVGDPVTVNGQLVMENFESKTLGRSFDEIIFGTVAGDDSPMPAGPEAKPMNVHLASLDGARPLRHQPCIFLS